MEGDIQTLDNTPGQGPVKFPNGDEPGSGDRFDNGTAKKKKRKYLIYTPLDKFLENIQDEHVHTV